MFKKLSKRKIHFSYQILSDSPELQHNNFIVNSKNEKKSVYNFFNQSLPIINLTKLSIDSTPNMSEL